MIYNPQLETFIKVADLGSFSKAADEIFITPTAVIKQINVLERTLGVQLFVRTHRGVTLTESGASLYNDARYLIQYAKSSITRAKDATNISKHIIRVGASPMTPTKFLIDLTSKIYTRCPNLRFQLVPFENTPESAEEIIKNFGRDIDLVVGIFDENPSRQRKSAGLELRKEPICLAVSIHSPLAKKDRLSIEDLFGETLMIIQRGWNKYIDVLRNDIAKKYPQIEIVEFSFYNTDVFNQCELNNYLLLSIAEWEDVHPLLKMIPVDWDYVVPFGLIYSPTPSEDVQTLIHAVSQICEIE